VTVTKARAFSEGFDIGGNVPWAVSWSAEQNFSLRPSVDFPGLVDLVQEEKPNQGSPKFAQMHVTRHRLGMARHMCHVCGRRTPRHDRYLFPLQSGSMVPAGESLRYVGNVPAMHLNCARRSQALCPHLIAALAAPMAYPSEESVLLPRTDIVAGMEALAATLPRGLPIVYSCYRVFGPRFSQKIARLRPAPA
jgi:hypothetical protein